MGRNIVSENNEIVTTSWMDPIKICSFAKIFSYLMHKNFPVKYLTSLFEQYFHMKQRNSKMKYSI